MIEANATPGTSALKAELAALAIGSRTDLIVERLKSEISAVLGIDAEFIDEDDTLDGLGADSLRLVALVGRLEGIVGFNVPPRLLAPKGSLRQLAELLAQCVAEPDPRTVLYQARATVVGKQIQSDIFLEPGTADATRSVTESEALDPKAVFVTGATGFLGAYLVRELVERTQARVHCLVRAGSPSAGLKRIADNLRRFNLWSAEIENRLVIEIGDLGEPQFGLSAQRYAELAANIDIVYHNGAAVHLTNPYEMVRAANVAGTRTILHLAGSVRRKPVAFVSSVGIFDTPELEREAVITETTTPKDIGLLPNGYVQSKLAGERLVDLAREAGLSVSILRVGHVIGDGVSEDLAGRMAQSCLIAGAVPLLTQPVDYVSPDYTASVIVEVPRRLDSSGIYHVTNPQPITMARVKDLLKFSPVTLRLLPIADWLAETRERALKDSSHPLFAAADMMDVSLGGGEKSFIEQILARPMIDCRRTSEAMTEAGLVCPPAEDILRDVLLGMPEVKALLASTLVSSPVHGGAVA